MGGGTKFSRMVIRQTFHASSCNGREREIQSYHYVSDLINPYQWLSHEQYFPRCWILPGQSRVSGGLGWNERVPYQETLSGLSVFCDGQPGCECEGVSI